MNIQCSHKNEHCIRVASVESGRGWEIGCHELARKVLLDRRLGESHAHPDEAAQVSLSPLSGAVGEDWRTVQLKASANRQLFARRLSALDADEQHALVLRHTLSAIEMMLTNSPPTDFHALVSSVIPLKVMMEVLGLPSDDFPMLAHLLCRLDDSAEGRIQRAAVQGLREYMSRQAGRSDSPKHTLRRDEHKLGPDLGTLMLIAGTLTVTHAMNLALYHLCTQVPKGVSGYSRLSLEECLRLPLLDADDVAGGPLLTRYAQESLIVNDAFVRQGELVVINLGRANTDPRVFTSPTTFESGRSPVRHLAFGYGPRSCPGSGLARLELTVLFQMLSLRVPDISLIDPVRTRRVLRRREPRPANFESFPIYVRWDERFTHQAPPNAEKSRDLQPRSQPMEIHRDERLQRTSE